MIGRLLDAVEQGKRFLEELEDSLKRNVIDDDLPIRITQDVSPRLFVLKDGVVRVSRWQASGLAEYTNMAEHEFILLCALLGLVQRSALEHSDFLIEEDCWHATPIDCLFSHVERKQDYARLLENPQICEGCLKFYSDFGVYHELVALQQLVGRLKSREDA